MSIRCVPANLSGRLAGSAAKQAFARVRLAVAAGGLSLLFGCATVPAGTVNDPFEGFNRSMFSFNDGLDKVILKPAATVYQAITPKFVRTGFSNFFANLGEPWVAVNAALQLKGQATVETLLRFAFNSVFGLGGVIDVATEVRLERRHEDFGQTLGYWGAQPGPYLVLPFFGSSSVRDGIGLVVDFQGDPLNRDPTLLTTDMHTPTYHCNPISPISAYFDAFPVISPHFGGGSSSSGGSWPSNTSERRRCR